MSKERLVETELFCSNCLKETTHEAVYQNGEIVKVTCNECNTSVALKRARQRKPFFKNIFLAK